MRVAVYLSLATLIAGLISGWYIKNSNVTKQLISIYAQHIKDLEFAYEEMLLVERDRDTAIAENAKLASELKIEREKNQKVIYEEVIRYIQSPDAGMCKLNDDWVRIHDKAATGSGVPEDARATSTPNDDTKEITDIEAITTVTANYGRCEENAAQLEELQGWVKALKKKEK